MPGFPVEIRENLSGKRGINCAVSFQHEMQSVLLRKVARQRNTIRLNADVERPSNRGNSPGVRSQDKNALLTIQSFSFTHKGVDAIRVQDDRQRRLLYQKPKQIPTVSACPPRPGPMASTSLFLRSASTRP